jgi:hypothetical protein
MRPCPGEAPLHENLASTSGISKPLALFIVRLLGLLPQYFIEFGFFFFALMFWRRTGLGSHDPDGLWRRLGTLTILAFLIGSTIVSVRTWNCDLNWRVMHPVQIILLGVAAAFLLDFRARSRPGLEKIGLLVVILFGFLGTIYDLYRARFDYVFRYPERARWAGLAERAARKINVMVPASERILFRPSELKDPGSNGFWCHYLRQHLVVTDRDFNVFPYGPSQKQVLSTLADIDVIFNESTTPADRLRLLENYKVHSVLLDESSPLFKGPEKHTFGPEASLTLSDSAEDWKLIKLSETRRGTENPRTGISGTP